MSPDTRTRRRLLAVGAAVSDCGAAAAGLGADEVEPHGAHAAPPAPAAHVVGGRLAEFIAATLQPPAGPLPSAQGRECSRAAAVPGAVTKTPIKGLSGAFLLSGAPPSPAPDAAGRPGDEH